MPRGFRGMASSLIALLPKLSVLKLKKKKKIFTTKEKHKSHLCKTDLNGDQYALLNHENFLLAITGRHKLSGPRHSKLLKQKEPDGTLWMCLRSSLNKFPSGQTRWCILANPKVLTPITYGGEMRHTVPLYCYKSFFVDGWQLFIRSNLFKPPL